MQLDLPGMRVERSMDGHAFLFEERYGFVYLLNDVSAFVLQELMQGDRTESELVDSIRQCFDFGSATDPVEDLKQFLSRLRSYGLLA